MGRQWRIEFAGALYHILLKTNLPNLSKAMQWFGLAYTRRFNNSHSRSGHLFQGRYKSIIIENDAHLIRLSCYIHRNPLRAGIVKRLADYKWSSYQYYAYRKKPPSWLVTDMILSQSKNDNNRNNAYRENVFTIQDLTRKCRRRLPGHFSCLSKGEFTCSRYSGHRKVF